MTDTQYKVTGLSQLQPLEPGTLALEPNTIMYHAPFREVCRAQDTVCGTSRRVLGIVGMSGHSGFHVPASGAPVVEVAATGSFPDRDNWRTVGYWLVPRLTPGCYLRARVYYIPSGNSQYEDPAGTWNPAGPFGAVRLIDDWTSGGSTSGPNNHDLILPVSSLANAASPTGEATYWHALANATVLNIRIDSLATASTSATYTEDTEATVQVQYRGAPRVVAIVLYEDPVVASYLHSADGPHAVNGQGNIEAPQSIVPQFEDADAATYDENRFGSHRLLNTAQRQQQVVGNAIASWLSWDEESQDDTADVSPISITSTSLVNIIDTSVTAYAAAGPGWVVAGSTAQTHELSDNQALGGVAVVVPGWVYVEARLQGGATAATIRIQSGTYEWIDIAVTSSSWTTHEASGYFESQVFPDHSHATLQVFAETDAGSVEIRGFGAVYGE